MLGGNFILCSISDNSNVPVPAVKCAGEVQKCQGCLQPAQGMGTPSLQSQCSKLSL